VWRWVAGRRWRRQGRWSSRLPGHSTVPAMTASVVVLGLYILTSHPRSPIPLLEPHGSSLSTTCCIVFSLHDCRRHSLQPEHAGRLDSPPSVSPGSIPRNRSILTALCICFDAHPPVSLVMQAPSPRRSRAMRLSSSPRCCWYVLRA
jgi:hypothetical protein